MLAPDLVKRQPDLLDARHQFADRGEMGRSEIPGERVAVEIAPEPAFMVPGTGRSLRKSIGHRHFSLLPAVYPPAAPSATPRIARMRGGSECTIARQGGGFLSN